MMSSNEDSTPALPKKPVKMFGPPRGGVALFGANAGLLGEMKSRLKRTDSGKGIEPSASDNPEPDEHTTQFTCPPVAPHCLSISSQKKSVGSEDESDSSMKASPHVIDESPLSQTKSSQEGDKLLKTIPPPPPSIALSDSNDLPTAMQEINETDVAYRRQDVTEGDEHLLQNLNTQRPRRPKTRPPTIYGLAQLTSTTSSSADRPSGDEQMSACPSCSDTANQESLGGNLDSFFRSWDADA